MGKCAWCRVEVEKLYDSEGMHEGQLCSCCLAAKRSAAEVRRWVDERRKGSKLERKRKKR